MNRARALLALWLSLACFLSVAAAGAQTKAAATAFRGHQLGLELLRPDLAVETATTSEGLEITNQLEIVSGINAGFQLDLAWSHVREEGADVPALAFAPSQSWSGGLAVESALGPGSASAGLRFGFSELALSFGYALSRVELGMDVENVLSGAPGPFTVGATATVFLD